MISELRLCMFNGKQKTFYLWLPRTVITEVEHGNSSRTKGQEKIAAKWHVQKKYMYLRLLEEDSTGLWARIPPVRILSNKGIPIKSSISISTSRMLSNILAEHLTSTLRKVDFSSRQQQLRKELILPRLCWCLRPKYAELQQQDLTESICLI